MKILPDFNNDIHPERSFKNKVSRFMWANLRHRMGHPELLCRFIREGTLRPLAISPVLDTLWHRSVVRWEEWMGFRNMWRSSPYHLCYRKPTRGCRKLVREDIFLPELVFLIEMHVYESYQYDIQEVRGISASKSRSRDIGNIDDFPLICCPELVLPVTPEHLADNMEHCEIRLDDMRFADYSWEQRRIYWLNGGGHTILPPHACRHSNCRYLFLSAAE